MNFNNGPRDLSALVAGMKKPGIAQVGATYEKYVKLFGQYMYLKNKVAGSWHVNTAQGGVSVPLGVGNAMASYAYSRDSGGLDQTRQAAVGDYPLSKRTDVYAAYERPHQRPVDRQHVRRRHPREVLTRTRGRRAGRG